MNDDTCEQFLKWALPRLRMTWAGFRKVRRQVCRRIRKRLTALQLTDVGDYQAFLEAYPEEWAVLDTFCRITVSRFYRDKCVFDFLEQTVFPELARSVMSRGRTPLRIWSIGCGSGEEPFSLSLLWKLRLSSLFPQVSREILATDADANMLERAANAVYPAGSLKELPDQFRTNGFERINDLYRLRSEYKNAIDFLHQDVRESKPEGTFHVVMCRNLVFTYFDVELRHEILPQLCQVLESQGAFVIGAKETLPEPNGELMPWSRQFRVYRKCV